MTNFQPINNQITFKNKEIIKGYAIIETVYTLDEQHDEIPFYTSIRFFTVKNKRNS